jgi:glutamate-1-semialdehyde 2,1-aminomutase
MRMTAMPLPDSAASTGAGARTVSCADRDAFDEALTAAKAHYAERRPASGAEWRSAARVMPGGNTRTILYFDPFPVCMTSGSGCHLADVDGIRYVDLLGEYTAGIYGHSNPVIQGAVIEALRNGLSLSAHNPAEVRLASLICARYPSIERVRFTNSGTEANLLAIATAAAFTRRERVLVFEGAYHGSLLKFGEPRSPINVPHRFIVAPYNDIAAARAAIREHSQHLAGILVEPMLGAGGCIPGDPVFLAALAEEARAVGALLIFDEIQTARLSTGGRQALLGITPDLTTLGKYHGGGLSFGAFGGRAQLMSLYDPRNPAALSHAGTFNNNVLSMAAGHAGLSKVLTAEALDGLNGRGDRLRARLNDLLAGIDARFNLTGLGSLMNFHCAAEPACASAGLSLLFFDLLERGYYIAPRGFIALSLPVDDATLDAFVDAVREVMQSRAALFCGR